MIEHNITISRRKHMAVSKIRNSFRSLTVVIALAGLVGLGMAVIIPPAITYAGHVCAPGTLREGQAIPHDSAAAADGFCSRETPPAAGLPSDCTGSTITS